MATLTIKVDNVTANAALSSITRQIELAGVASKNLSAITATISGHWLTADQAVKRYEASVRTASAATGTIAGQVKSIAAEWLNAASAVGKYNAAAKNAPSPSSGGGFGGSFTGGAGFTAFSPVSVPRPTPPPIPSRVGPPPIPRPTAQSAPVLNRAPSGGGDAFGAGFSALSGGLGKAITSTLSTATTIFGNGLASAASGVGGLILGGVTGVVGAVGSAIGSAFKVGVKILEDGVKGAVSLLETGAKVGLGVAAGLLVNSVRLAVKEEPIKEGFASIFGTEEQTGALGKLRAAAKDTVSDFDLMKRANLAYQLGAVRSAEDTGVLIEAARKLGKSVGRDATEAFNDLVVGIGRQSNRVLDNVGIIVRAEDAYDAYAKSVGTTSEKLSEAEKRLVFIDAAFDAIRKKSAITPDSLTAGDSIAKAVTQFERLSTAVGERFLPVLSNVAGRWADFLGSLDADQIVGGIEAAFNGVAKLGGGVLDFVFGKGSDASSTASGFASSIYNAITNPSTAAFKVVAIRGEQFLNGLVGGFQILWERFKAWGLKAIDDVVSALIPLNGLFESVRKLTTGRSFAGDVNDTRDFNIANIGKETAGKNRDLDKLIAEISQSSASPGGGGIVESGRLVSARSGAGGLDGANVNVFAKRAAALADETRAREEEQAAIMAAKEALDAQEKAIRAEIDMREGLLSQYKKEESVNARRIEALQKASDNARAARVGGEDPNITIADRLGKFADQLRSLPGVISDLKDQIVDSNTTIARMNIDNFREYQRAKQAFSREIQGLTSSFLNQGPQDFETVRVRSIKRRFQRDRARSNAELVNNAFRGPSFGVEGGDFGGFGTQNIERAGSPTNQRFPALESALLRLKDDRGETLLQQAQERVASLLQEQAARVEKVKAKQVELLATEKEALAAQTAANEGIIAALEQSAAVQKQLAVNDARAEAQAARIEADLAALKKALEEVARRAKR